MSLRKNSKRVKQLSRCIGLVLVLGSISAFVGHSYAESSEAAGSSYDIDDASQMTEDYNADVDTNLLLQSLRYNEPLGSKNVLTHNINTGTHDLTIRQTTDFMPIAILDIEAKQKDITIQNTANITQTGLGDIAFNVGNGHSVTVKAKNIKLLLTNVWADGSSERTRDGRLINSAFFLGDTMDLHNIFFKGVNGYVAKNVIFADDNSTVKSIQLADKIISDSTNRFGVENEAVSLDGETGAAYIAANSIHMASGFNQEHTGTHIYGKNIEAGKLTVKTYTSTDPFPKEKRVQINTFADNNVEKAPKIVFSGGLDLEKGWVSIGDTVNEEVTSYENNHPLVNTTGYVQFGSLTENQPFGNNDHFFATATKQYFSEDTEHPYPELFITGDLNNDLSNYVDGVGNFVSNMPVNLLGTKISKLILNGNNGNFFIGNVDPYSDTPAKTAVLFMGRRTYEGDEDSGITNIVNRGQMRIVVGAYTVSDKPEASLSGLVSIWGNFTNESNANTWISGAREINIGRDTTTINGKLIKTLFGDGVPKKIDTTLRNDGWFELASNAHAFVGEVDPIYKTNPEALNSDAVHVYSNIINTGDIKLRGNIITVGDPSADAQTLETRTAIENTYSSKDKEFQFFGNQITVYGNIKNEYDLTNKKPALIEVKEEKRGKDGERRKLDIDSAHSYFKVNGKTQNSGYIDLYTSHVVFGPDNNEIGDPVLDLSGDGFIYQKGQSFTVNGNFKLAGGQVYIAATQIYNQGDNVVAYENRNAATVEVHGNWEGNQRVPDLTKIDSRVDNTVNPGSYGDDYYTSHGIVAMPFSWDTNNTAYWDSAKKELVSVSSGGSNDSSTLVIDGTVTGNTRIRPFYLDDEGGYIYDKIKGSVNLSDSRFANHKKIYAYKPVVVIKNHHALLSAHAFYGYGILDNGDIAQLTALPMDKDGNTNITWELINPTATELPAVLQPVMDADSSGFSGDRDLDIIFSKDHDTINSDEKVDVGSHSIKFRAKDEENKEIEGKNQVNEFEVTTKGTVTMDSSLGQMHNLQGARLDLTGSSIDVNTPYVGDGNSVLNLRASTVSMNDGNIHVAKGDDYTAINIAKTITGNMPYYAPADQISIGKKEDSPTNTLTLEKQFVAVGQKIAVNAAKLHTDADTDSVGTVFVGNKVNVSAPIVNGADSGADRSLTRFYSLLDGDKRSNIAIDNSVTNNGELLAGAPFNSADNSTDKEWAEGLSNTEYQNGYFRIGNLDKNSSVINHNRLYLYGENKPVVRIGDNGTDTVKTYVTNVIAGDVTNDVAAAKNVEARVGSEKPGMGVSGALVFIGSYQGSHIDNKADSPMRLEGADVQIGRRVSDSTGTLHPSTFDNGGTVNVSLTPVAKSDGEPGLSAVASIWGNTNNSGTMSINGARAVNIGYEKPELNQDALAPYFAKQEAKPATTFTNTGKLDIGTRAFDLKTEGRVADPAGADGIGEQVNLYSKVINSKEITVHSPSLVVGDDSTKTSGPALTNSDFMNYVGERMTINGSVVNTGTLRLSGYHADWSKATAPAVHEAPANVAVHGDWTGTSEAPYEDMDGMAVIPEVTSLEGVKYYGKSVVGEGTTVESPSPVMALLALAAVPENGEATDSSTEHAAIQLRSSWTKENTAYWDGSKFVPFTEGAQGNDTDTITIDGNVHGYTRVIPHTVDSYGGNQIKYNHIAGTVLDASNEAFKSHKQLFAYKPVITVTKDHTLEHPNSLYGYGVLDDGSVAQLATVKAADGNHYSTWVLVNPNYEAPKPPEEKKDTEHLIQTKGEQEKSPPKDKPAGGADESTKPSGDGAGTISSTTDQGSKPSDVVPPKGDTQTSPDTQDGKGNVPASEGESDTHGDGVSQPKDGGTEHSGETVNPSDVTSPSDKTGDKNHEQPNNQGEGGTQPDSSDHGAKTGPSGEGNPTYQSHETKPAGSEDHTVSGEQSKPEHTNTSGQGGAGPDTQATGSSSETHPADSTIHRDDVASTNASGPAASTKLTTAVVKSSELAVGMHGAQAFGHTSTAFLPQGNVAGLNNINTGVSANRVLWAHMVGGIHRSDNGIQFSNRETIKGIEVGADIGKGSGVYIGYGTNRTTINDAFAPTFNKETRNVESMSREVGSVDTKLGVVGLYHHHDVNERAYVNVIGQAAFGTSDLLASQIDPSDPMNKGHVSGHSYILSTEYGIRVSAPSATRQVQVQSQLIGQWSGTGAFDIAGKRLQASSHGVTARVGLRMDWGSVPAMVQRNDGAGRYVAVNLYHRYGGDNVLGYGTSRYEMAYAPTWYDLSVGGRYTPTANFIIDGNVNYSHTLGTVNGSGHGWHLNLDLRRTF